MLPFAIALGLRQFRRATFYQFFGGASVRVGVGGIYDNVGPSVVATPVAATPVVKAFDIEMK